jgi:RNA polymerase sigma-70 factor (ECF subfamily)
LTPDQTDKPLLPLSQMGPFEQLFKNNYAFVCHIVNRYVTDKSKVEDITQDIFIELWMKREQVIIHTSVQAYLRRMAISRALNYLRDTKKHDWSELDQATDTNQATMHQQPEVINQLEEQELARFLNNAINELPEKCKIIFNLSRYDGLSYAEIARQLDISVKTVENQIGKALKYLRQAILINRG